MAQQAGKQRFDTSLCLLSALEAAAALRLKLQGTVLAHQQSISELGFKEVDLKTLLQPVICQITFHQHRFAFVLLFPPI